MLEVKNSPHAIFQEIKETVETLFGIHLRHPEAIHLGYLNLKWKVETEDGLVVIKQISKERYLRHDYQKVSLEQDVALREQLRQYTNGTRCPKVWTRHNKVIYKTKSGERFIIMEYMEGKNLMPGTLNEKQMYSLGQMTGHMHNVSNDGTHSMEGSPKFLPPSIAQRLDHWESFYKKADLEDEFLDLVEKQIQATEQFNLDWLHSCETGWAHRDLWVDNILFNEDELAAILDFDRFAFDYPEMDLARGIYVRVVKGKAFNLESASAFLEGYRTRRHLEKGTFVRALYLLWWLESVWWVVPHCNKDRYQEVQFQNEMMWLADHLPQLSSMFGNW